MAVVEEYSEVYAGKVTARTEVSVGSSEGNLRRRPALVRLPLPANGEVMARRAEHYG
jgi:hypothetical protein